MWTRFEGDRHVTVAGLWDTSRGTVEKTSVKAKAETGGKGDARNQGNAMKGAGKSGVHNGGPSGSSKSWGYQGQC